MVTVVSTCAQTHTSTLKYLFRTVVSMCKTSKKSKWICSICMRLDIRVGSHVEGLTSARPPLWMKRSRGPLKSRRLKTASDVTGAAVDAEVISSTDDRSRSSSHHDVDIIMLAACVLVSILVKLAHKLELTAQLRRSYCSTLGDLDLGLGSS